MSSPALIDMRASDIMPGDHVWVGGALQRVIAAGPGSMPHFTELAVASGAAYQFPDAGTLQVQFAPVEWVEIHQ